MNSGRDRNADNRKEPPKMKTLYFYIKNRANSQFLSCCSPDQSIRSFLRGFTICVTPMSFVLTKVPPSWHRIWPLPQFEMAETVLRNVIKQSTVFRTTIHQLANQVSSSSSSSPSLSRAQAITWINRRKCEPECYSIKLQTWGNVCRWNRLDKQWHTLKIGVGYIAQLQRK